MRRNHYFLLSLLTLLFIVLAACGKGGEPVSARGIPVRITETDFHIASSVTKFVPGKTYHFLVTNQGQSMHEFMLMPKPEGRMTDMSMENMDKVALASITMIDPGDTEAFNYTFPASMAGSHPEFACYFPNHYEAGMKLDVSVNAT